MEKVSYLIINYNGARFLDSCIQSILDQTWQQREIMVLDNESVDQSEQVCAKYPVQFIRTGANLGIAGAANKGAKLASGSCLFLINPDIKLEKDCTRLLVETLEKNPDAFCADPSQLDWEARKIIHGRTYFERALARGAELGLYRVRFDGLAEAPAAVPWGCAGCMMMRREKLESIGGFDEKFFLEWEDAEICWRAWRMGHPTLFVPAAVSFHYVGFSQDAELAGLDIKTRPMDRARLESYYENLLRLTIKEMPAEIYVLTAARLAAKLPFLFILRPPTGLAVAKAIIRVLRDMKNILKQRAEINQASEISARELFKRFLS